VSGFVPILKRELLVFFVTPLAWVLVTVFLLVQGLHFFLIVDHFSTQPATAAVEAPLQAFFGNTVLLYLVLFLLVPPLTMRLFAEERRSGTIEALLTAPVSPAAVVLAKYTAALVAYAFMWAPTALYVVILRRTGEVDLRVVGATYGGILLVGAAYLAIGLFASAVTRSQFIAFLLTAAVMLALFVVGIGEFVAREGSTMHAIATHVSVWAHMNELASGVVDSRRLVFYGTLTAVPLFATTRLVDAWRWSGA
jgi:ABC-2 type transport system permease protein